MIFDGLILFSLILLLYPYIVFPFILWMRAMLFPRTIDKRTFVTNVTIIIAVHNESRYIQRKLESIFNLNWPAERLEIMVVSDGSTDATDEIVAGNSDPRLHLIRLGSRSGKAAALNAAMSLAKGEIVVFTDARQIMERDSLRELVANFNDPSVGCVSGNLLLGAISETATATGEALKWKLENRIREWEGQTTSVIGALGAFYGVRRQHLVEIPSGTLLDDCYLPLSIVRRGCRTVFEAKARVWDDIVTSPRQEFQRKVRTLTGNYQLLRMAPWLLTPQNPVLFEFISHKLFRLLTPFALILFFGASCLSPHAWVRIVGLLQALAYLFGTASIIWPFSSIASIHPIEICRAFLLLSAAGLKAFINFVSGSNEVWMRESVPSSLEQSGPTTQ